jgi:hypothetical protein
MRHLMPLTKALTVTAGSFGVGKPTPATLLITPSGLPQRTGTRRLRTPAAAIDLAPVTTAANQHLSATAPAEKQSTRRLHRHA